MRESTRNMLLAEIDSLAAHAKSVKARIDVAIDDDERASSAMSPSQPISHDAPAEPPKTE